VTAALGSSVTVGALEGVAVGATSPPEQPIGNIKIKEKINIFTIPFIKKSPVILSKCLFLTDIVPHKRHVVH